MQGSDYLAALEAAIARTRARERNLMVFFTAAFAVYCVGSIAFGMVPFGGLILALALGVGWWRWMTDRVPAVRDLVRMRGARVDAWWPSPSHQLIAHTERAVLAGRLGQVLLDPDAPRRLFAASYDEAKHALVLTVHTRKPTRDDPEYVEVKQHAVALARSVPAEEAYAAARLLDARAPLPRA